MSSLTRCNFCTLRDLQRFAGQTGQKLELRETTMTGENRDEQRPFDSTGRPVGKDVLIGGHFAAWLWVITDHCVCYQ